MLSRIFPRFALLFFLAAGPANFIRAQSNANAPRFSGTQERLILARGSAVLQLDLNRLNGIEGAVRKAPPVALAFRAAPQSFFTLITLNGELRDVEPGAMELQPQGAAAHLPPALGAAWQRLALVRLPWGEAQEFALRDRASGFTFFYLEGVQFHYDAAARAFTLSGGRLLLAPEFAKMLGRPAEAGVGVGTVNAEASMSSLEVTRIVDGEVQAAVLPPLAGRVAAPEALVNGPDVIVGDLPSLVQSGSSGTQVGLAVATTSCNNGNQELNWLALPNNDHPVIPQNLYRMSGGSANSDRFEQIGQSWLKHAYTALQQDACGFGCSNSGTGSRLGRGCSDPYSTTLNASQTGLGSRAWVNPFTGSFPRGDSGTSPSDHSGHTHIGTSHRVLVEAADLNTALNAGATYFAEAQYVTPHEYAWCQAHTGECNMYNNASYRRFNVSGTSSFSFTPVGSTVATQPAINAWTGAILQRFEPAPGADGIGYLAYKVSGPVNGLYHYEYALYNQNLDRGLQAFSLPLGCGITLSSVGFHAPLNSPAFSNDGTQNSAGFSNAAWSTTQTTAAIRWASETFAQNQNANAIRWGTLYNFRFDSARPPVSSNATISFFKTGAPLTLKVQGPAPDPAASCTPPATVSAVSRKSHGAAGDFDLALPLSGTPAVETRDGGASGDYHVVIVFSRPVTMDSALVTTSKAGGSVDASVDSSSVTLDLHGIQNAQTISVQLNNLNDGLNAGNLSVPLSILVGDVNGDGSVNSGDSLVTRNFSGATLDAGNFRCDVNSDGSINSGDSIIVRAHSGEALEGVAARRR